MSSKVMGIVYALVSLLVLSILLPLQFTGLTAIITGMNVTVTAAFVGLASFIGLAPILVLLLALFETGLISFTGFTGGKVGTKAIIQVVSSQVVLYVGIILFPSIVTNWYTLYLAAGATSQGFVGICPLLFFIGLILGTGWWAVKATGGVKAIRSFRARHGRRAYAH